MQCYRWRQDVLLIDIRDQPGAKHDEIASIHGSRLKIRINAPPVDGKANTQLVKYISQVFKVRRTRVKILSGEKSRDKQLEITAPQRLPGMVFNPDIS